MQTFAMLNVRTLLLIVAGITLFGSGLWMGRAEAPTPEDVHIPEEVTSSTPATTPETANTGAAPFTPLVAPPSTASPTTKPATPAKPKVPAVTLITYDGEYFSPREVTVLEGGTVRFMNLSKEDMWVASNLHPVHSGYPVRDNKSCSGYAFDMCKPVGINGTWDFTFTRQGTYGFHNHIRPISTGKIEVNDPNEKPSIPSR
jgi:plastocyanin